MKTETKKANWYIGYDFVPRGKSGRIYLDQIHFANFWVIEGWGPENEGKIAFNRDAKALQMNCPIIGPEDSIENIIKILDCWFQRITE